MGFPFLNVKVIQWIRRLRLANSSRAALDTHNGVGVSNSSFSSWYIFASYLLSRLIRMNRICRSRGWISIHLLS